MNIEEKLIEVADYFKAKLIAGDYEIIKVKANYVTIKIDDKYEFEVWIYGDMEKDFDFYFGLFSESVMSPRMTIQTPEERLEGWKNLKVKMDQFVDETGHKAKVEKFNELKKELGF